MGPGWSGEALGVPSPAFHALGREILLVGAAIVLPHVEEVEMIKILQGAGIAAQYCCEVWLDAAQSLCGLLLPRSS
jgi:hypothetical protein